MTIRQSWNKQLWLIDICATWGKHAFLIGLLALFEFGLLRYCEYQSRSALAPATKAQVWIPGSEWSMDAKAKWAAARVLLRSEPSQSENLAGVTLVDLEGQRSYSVPCDDSNPLAVCLSPDTVWLVIATVNRPLRVIYQPLQAELTSRSVEIDIPDQWVERLAFSPDGKFLAAAGERHTMVIDWATQRIAWQRARTQTASPLLRFSADSRQLASLRSDGSLAIWDTSSGDLHGQMELQNRQLVDAVWSNSSKSWVLVSLDQRGLVASEMGSHGLPSELWRIEKGFRLASIASNGRRLAISDTSGSQDEISVQILDIVSGAQVFSLPIQVSLAGMSLSPSNALFLWDRSGKIHTIQTERHATERDSCAFNLQQTFVLADSRS